MHFLQKFHSHKKKKQINLHLNSEHSESHYMPTIIDMPVIKSVTLLPELKRQCNR